MELPLTRVLGKMQSNGIYVNSEILDRILIEFKQNQDELIKEIYELAGVEFNINSPKQVGEILYEKLKIKPLGKKPDTAIDTLHKLSKYHPVIEKIIAYRKVSKLISTYLEAFKTILKNQKTPYIHTTFNQVGTVTGRLSSLDPNLQNIPVKTEMGREIRKMFVSRFENGKIISIDYNQIELRLMAHLSGDVNMIAAYNNGADIHKLTASQVFDIPFDEVTKPQRDSAKSVNFGIIYGISSFGLSEQLGISPIEAKKYIDTYFERFKSVKQFMDDTIKIANKNGGEVSTIFGRKRKILEIFNTNFAIRGFGERAAINTPLQGSASDIIKIAMVKVQNRIEEENFKTVLMLQIHDELVLDSPASEVEKVTKLVKEEMEKIIKLKVPLIADVEVGNSWFDV
jgi:DNA polymerase-1